MKMKIHGLALCAISAISMLSTAHAQDGNLDNLLSMPEIPRGQPPSLEAPTSPDQQQTVIETAPAPVVDVEPTPEAGIPAISVPVEEGLVDKGPIDVSDHAEPAPIEDRIEDPVAAMHAAYAGIRADVLVAYEGGNKIAWRSDVACIMRISGWKPWSSGNRELKEAADVCAQIGLDVESAAPYEGEFRLSMDQGHIRVSQEIGSGPEWSLSRHMTCGLDGIPISTVLEGNAISGKQKVSINTPRAFSAPALAAAESECLVALRSVL